MVKEGGEGVVWLKKGDSRGIDAVTYRDASSSVCQMFSDMYVNKKNLLNCLSLQKICIQKLWRSTQYESVTV